jgi:hypothetical protein
MATPEPCVILDIPQGLSLNLLGLSSRLARSESSLTGPVCSAESWRL